ncbi:hypothetical protein [Spirosoma linguale]|uniref:hypothetical protein n=1 Tax=Spirosoma linguale TaxID=108 RepID=UPI0001A3B79A
MQRTHFFIIALLMSALTTQAQPMADKSYRYDPPWNQPPKGGVSFTVPGVDNVPDLYGDIVNPQLIVFMGGNQFMVLDELLTAFRKQYPAYTRIFVETLPPGILAKQMNSGSIVIGNLRIDHTPDVYNASRKTATNSTVSLLTPATNWRSWCEKGIRSR